MNTVADQFENAERQRQSAELGMWVFLATEIMFFAPLFFGYLYGRWALPEGFAAASRHTDIVIGTINTAVLLTSSLMMALGVRAAQLQQRRATVVFLLLTAGLGCSFLGLKGLEYYQEWREHLIPWLDFRFEPRNRGAVALFYFLYFGMTGLHAIHLTIGVVMTGLFAARVRVRNVASLRNQIEMGALYWHFVDSVWVFLYPLIYLLERYK
jgi:cytochrome c oxidase subunit III